MSTSITASAPSATASPTTPTWRLIWHVREDLFALSHQYRRYGRGKGAMILKNGPRALAARHLAPPALIVAFTLAALAAVLGRPRPAVVMGVPYALVVGTGAAAAWVGRPRGEPVSLPALPAALVAMHVAWGVGFLEGLLARRRAAAGSLVHPQLRTPSPQAADDGPHGPGGPRSTARSTRRPRRSRPRRRRGRRVARPRRPPAAATGPR